MTAILRKKKLQTYNPIAKSAGFARNREPNSIRTVSNTKDRQSHNIEVNS